MFTTPWISVSVTMSPFATCVISWPSTASTSLRLMPRSRPVLTATSASFAPRARGEGVRLRRVEDADFRHADALLLRQRPNRADQPLLVAVGGLLDDPDAHGSLGHPLRHGQRYQRAAEAEQRRHHEQAFVAAAVGGQPAIEPRDARHDRQHRDDRQVRGQEQEYSLHDSETLDAYKMVVCAREFKPPLQPSVSPDYFTRSGPRRPPDPPPR